MFVIIGPKSRAASLASENLCPKCSYYSKVKYGLDDSETHKCSNLGIRLRGPVSECTDFYDKTKPSKRDLESIAWVIETSKREVGFGAGVKFIPPSEQKKKKNSFEDL